MPRETYTAMIRRQMRERGVVPLAQRERVWNPSFRRYNEAMRRALSDRLSLLYHTSYPPLPAAAYIQPMFVETPLTDEQARELNEIGARFWPPTDPPGT